jgi:hypothetical protein
MTSKKNNATFMGLLDWRREIHQIWRHKDLALLGVVKPFSNKTRTEIGWIIPEKGKTTATGLPAGRYVTMKMDEKNPNMVNVGFGVGLVSLNSNDMLMGRFYTEQYLPHASEEIYQYLVNGIVPDTQGLPN